MFSGLRLGQTRCWGHRDALSTEIHTGRKRQREFSVIGAPDRGDAAGCRHREGRLLLVSGDRGEAVAVASRRKSSPDLKPCCPVGRVAHHAHSRSFSLEARASWSASGLMSCPCQQPSISFVGVLTPCLRVPLRNRTNRR